MSKVPVFDEQKWREQNAWNVHSASFRSTPSQIDFLSNDNYQIDSYEDSAKYSGSKCSSKSKHYDIALARQKKDQPSPKKIEFEKRRIFVYKHLLETNGIPYPKSAPEVNEFYSGIINNQDISNICCRTEETETTKIQQDESPKTIGIEILEELLNRTPHMGKGKEVSEKLKMLSFLVHNKSAAGYNLLRDVKIPFPDESTLRKLTKRYVKDFERKLTDSSLTESLIEDYVIEYDLLKNDVPLAANIALDAMSIEALMIGKKQSKNKSKHKSKDCTEEIREKTIILLKDRKTTDSSSVTETDEVQDEYIKNCFVILLLPLDPKYPPLPLRIIGQENGMMNDEIDSQIIEIIEDCQRHNINIRYISTDGDKHYDAEHTRAFDRYKAYLDSTSLEDLANYMNEYNLMPVSDPLHLLKIARGRLLKGTISMDLTQDTLISSSSIEETLNLGNSLNDRSSIGQMRDCYPLEIFTIQNMIKLGESGKINEAKYLLPFAMFAEALRNPIYDLFTRLQLLNISFSVFRHYYAQISKYKKLPNGFSQNLNGATIALSFANKANLIRWLNTIIAIYHSLLYNDNVALGRIGTHDLEALFGQIRIDSAFKHTWANAKRILAKKLLSREFKIKLQLPTATRGRLNEGGVKIGFIEGNEQIIIEDVEELVNIAYNSLEMPDGIVSILEEMKTLFEDHESKIPKVYERGLFAAKGIISRYESNKCV